MCCQCRFRFWSLPVSSRKLLILPICRLLHFDGANTPLCAACCSCSMLQIAAGGEMLREGPGPPPADICFYGGRWITSSPPAAATTASPSIIAYFPIFWGHISASAFIHQQLACIYEGKRVSCIRRATANVCMIPSSILSLLSLDLQLCIFSVDRLAPGQGTEFLCRKIMRLAAWICIMAVILWILAKMALL